MSDPAVGDPAVDARTSTGGAASSVPAEDRGRLAVASRAVESVAAHEARRVARRLGAVPSARPSVSAKGAGSPTALEVQLTLPWGPVVSETAATAHREVRERTAALTGLAVDDVRLTVSGLAARPGAEVTGPPADPVDAPVPRPAPAPRGAGPAVAWGLLVSVAVVALGAVAAHDALVGSGVLEESSWIVAALDAVDGTEPRAWVLAAGLVAVVLGLLLVVAALRPRPQRALTFTEPAAVSLLVRDLPRAASGVARGVDGVLTAKSDATRRRVRVWIGTTGDAGVATAVRAALDEQFSVLSRPPRVVVIDTARSPS